MRRSKPSVKIGFHYKHWKPPFNTVVSTTYLSTNRYREQYVYLLHLNDVFEELLISVLHLNGVSFLNILTISESA